MAVTIKTNQEIEKMRVAGRLAGEVLQTGESVAGLAIGQLSQFLRHGLVKLVFIV